MSRTRIFEVAFVNPDEDMPGCWTWQVWHEIRGLGGPNHEPVQEDTDGHEDSLQAAKDAVRACAGVDLDWEQPNDEGTSPGAWRAYAVPTDS